MEHIESFIKVENNPTELAVSLVTDLVVRNVVCVEVALGNATFLADYLLTCPLLMAHSLDVLCSSIRC